MNLTPFGSGSATPEPEELRRSPVGFHAVLFPEERWHYLFHLLVVGVAWAYWLGSLLGLPEASGAEIVLYRPHGDNQVYPVITALSRLNLGDPADALHYGSGIAGFHALILLPYAVAYGLCGPAGYALADAFLSWAYFVPIVVLLRKTRFGTIPSLVAGAGLATGSIQYLTHILSPALGRIAEHLGSSLAEWSFPDLVTLAIAGNRIPRPIITEVLVALSLCALIDLWSGRSAPRWQRGLALGATLTLLMQGDPYSFAALGLTTLAVGARGLMRHRWPFPWSFAGGAFAGALVCGGYFAYQMTGQHPDAAARFGLVTFPRDRILWLPGWGPILRVAIVGLLAGVVVWLARTVASPADDTAEQSRAPATGCNASDVAGFCFTLVVAAWVAQPIQVLILGKSSQIHHYYLVTLPAFYSYAVFILAGQTVRLLHTPGRVGPFFVPKHAQGPLLIGCMVAELALGIAPAVKAIRSKETARDENSRWKLLGTHYRPGFRGLDHAFLEIPQLRDSRSFATFNHEVYFLLTAFREKRAYLPDNGFTTLSDQELERRLMEICKICQMEPKRFANFIQNREVLNYWLGCAKYWFTPEKTFAPMNDYTQAALEELRHIPRQSGFTVGLPISQQRRLTARYRQVLAEPSDVRLFPDVLILTVLATQEGVTPDPRLYREIHRNAVFRTYSKAVQTGTYSRPGDDEGAG